ncbi:MAG: DUF1249 domain-containing protein [Gammaproteobacteria bacterium]|nr:DUF1249 domain-containing protein [Gammaproteobacteria bacterium]NBT45066.1 DUF1249 domain-containing protein [Gammaproteobacteria bacterium]NBY22690.1 DUF1249 domain-containing protein [Gammaproteobacteria bacterium]NDE34075.1 DUF1249 domain-containing protein [Gammaproteobacteria bacterium]NDE56040.1 DUF1249 domain-containing protein [Gammaproteobacteria bacterium]
MVYRFFPEEKALWLHHLCEANFSRLERLIPGFEGIEDESVGCARGKPALYLRLLERSPFTLVIELTHDFSGEPPLIFEPNVRIRVCLDARTVEMLSDDERPHVHLALRDEEAPAAILDYKWEMNYFLSRWLDHCLAAGYRFPLREVSRDLASA